MTGPSETAAPESPPDDTERDSGIGFVTAGREPAGDRRFRIAQVV
jgi:hypothetical protein